MGHKPWDRPPEPRSPDAERGDLIQIRDVDGTLSRCIVTKATPSQDGTGVTYDLLADPFPGRPSADGDHECVTTAEPMGIGPGGHDVDDLARAVGLHPPSMVCPHELTYLDGRCPICDT